MRSEEWRLKHNRQGRNTMIYKVSGSSSLNKTCPQHKTQFILSCSLSVTEMVLLSGLSRTNSVRSNERTILDHQTNTVGSQANTVWWLKIRVRPSNEHSLIIKQTVFDHQTNSIRSSNERTNIVRSSNEQCVASVTVRLQQWHTIARRRHEHCANTVITLFTLYEHCVHTVWTLESHSEQCVNTVITLCSHYERGGTPDVSICYVASIVIDGWETGRVNLAELHWAGSSYGRTPRRLTSNVCARRGCGQFLDCPLASWRIETHPRRLQPFSNNK